MRVKVNKNVFIVAVEHKLKYSNVGYENYEYLTIVLEMAKIHQEDTIEVDVKTYTLVRGLLV